MQFSPQESSAIRGLVLSSQYKVLRSFVAKRIAGLSMRMVSLPIDQVPYVQGRITELQLMLNEMQMISQGHAVSGLSLESSEDYDRKRELDNEFQQKSIQENGILAEEIEGEIIELAEEGLTLNNSADKENGGN